MAERLTPIRAPFTPKFIPPDPKEEAYRLWLDGMDPEVTLIGSVASEEKTAPNYSDWLRAQT